MIDLSAARRLQAARRQERDQHAADVAARIQAARDLRALAARLNCGGAQTAAEAGATHEAGHAVAVVTVGLRLLSAAVEDSGAGLTSYQEPDRSLAHAVAVVLCAGPEAQRALAPRVLGDDYYGRNVKTDTKTDWHTLQQLLRTRSVVAADYAVASAQEDAARLVRNCRRAICLVAAVLVRDGRIAGRTVERICEDAGYCP